MKNLKFSLYILLCTFIIAIGFSSCSKVLDKAENLSQYPPDGVFNDLAQSNAYLANLYGSSLPNSWPLNDGNSADESGGITGPDAITVNSSRIFWPYDVIRKLNIFINTIPTGTLADANKSNLVAQAKFLRAFLYFKTLVYYGGVPIIKEAQGINDELKVPRNSTAECFTFIEGDLNEAEAALPPKYSGNDRGRIDQATVKAFRGRVLLYKASPQFNSANPYDNQYWAAAYQANSDAKTFLDANGYGLLDNYSNVFTVKGNQECIMSVIGLNPGKVNLRGDDAVRPLSESKNATGGDQPIWALVQAYPMLDGKKITDPTSAYTYNEQSFWLNRDPRFAQTIVYNGAPFALSGKAGRRQYTMKNVASSLDAFGFAIQGESAYRTGFFTSKGLNLALPAPPTTSDYDWNEIRYAEVLFNLAESANETGHSNESQAVLIAIRKRAGILPGSDGLYGLKGGMSRAEMRTAILDEKYVEFAFEGKRYWDLRRHRLFATKLNGIHKYGMMATTVNGRTADQVNPTDISNAAAYTLLPENFGYTVTELITSGPTTMVVPDTYYFFPIPLDYINQNPNLKQNIAWGGTFNPEL
ncbi:RagB/SusD family nutrient uptake outer membrane protein [Pedobacter foliorum]|uniref:RagB/SusD family nutrient uptake outer membrane protein n=1 Tax=Pedobacter foliorum TaxID=2739058 RepID=UPI001567A0F0|nr:RagB/SusD family nutrient uptake outer membrane protein [Pedobacter foliorum]NRF40883.1 RagB/SusD family nutrient uptake outer membrane protein [Pedobacter foliorum]